MRKNVKLLLLILWMVVIFMFSNQVATSSSESTNIVIIILYKIFSFFNNNISLIDFTNVLFTPVRKIAHFSEYMILGILAILYFDEINKNNKYLYAIVLSSIYAISDEIHQIFVDGRACTILDMCIDICGALVGVLLFYLVFKRWRKE